MTRKRFLPLVEMTRKRFLPLAGLTKAPINLTGGYMPFTKHLKNLGDNYYSIDLLDEVTSALRAKMKRRGLWPNASPAWLGYNIYENWDENGAFNDISLDCYDYIMARLDNLRVAMTQSQNVDGLVSQYIGFFIMERQKTQDSVGYAVFQHAQKAVQSAIEKKVLTPNNKGKLSNQTLLTFSSSDSTTSSEEEIYEALHNNKAWVAIRQQVGKKDKTVQKSLYKILCQLPKYAINCFRFKSLVDAMKKEVRALFPQPEIISKDDPENDSELPSTENEHIYIHEEYECWRDWCNKMEQAIAQLDVSPKIRDKCHKVFTERVNLVENNLSSPPQAEIAKRTGFAQGAINGYMKHLRKLAHDIDLNECKSPILDGLIGLTLK
jgi:hypothetical protein